MHRYRKIRNLILIFVQFSFCSTLTTQNCVLLYIYHRYSFEINDSTTNYYLFNPELNCDLEIEIDLDSPPDEICFANHTSIDSFKTIILKKIELKNQDKNTVINHLFNFFEFVSIHKKINALDYFKIPLKLIIKEPNALNNLAIMGKHPDNEIVDLLIYFEGAFEENLKYKTIPLFKDNIQIGLKFEGIKHKSSISFIYFNPNVEGFYRLLPNYLPNFLSF